MVSSLLAFFKALSAFARLMDGLPEHISPRPDVDLWEVLVLKLDRLADQALTTKNRIPSASLREVRKAAEASMVTKMTWDDA